MPVASSCTGQLVRSWLLVDDLRGPFPFCCLVSRGNVLSLLGRLLLLGATLLSQYVLMKAKCLIDRYGCRFLLRPGVRLGRGLTAFRDFGFPASDGKHQQDQNCSPSLSQSGASPWRPLPGFHGLSVPA